MPSTLPVPQKTHPKGSITGFVLSIIGLLAAAIGSGLIHARFKDTTPPVDTGQKIGDAVAKGTGHVILSIIGVPFLVVGFVLAAIALIFVLIRFAKKLGAGAIAFSAISILLSVWTFFIVVGAFSLIKAH